MKAKTPVAYVVNKSTSPWSISTVLATDPNGRTMAACVADCRAELRAAHLRYMASLS